MEKLTSHVNFYTGLPPNGISSLTIFRQIRIDDRTTDITKYLSLFAACETIFLSSFWRREYAFAKCCISEILTAIKWEERRVGCLTWFLVRRRKITGYPGAGKGMPGQVKYDIPWNCFHTTEFRVF